MSASETRARPAADPTPATPWKIVIVDDSGDDVELACIELAQAGIDAQCRRVDSEQQLRETLATFTPDLVLSDVNMPGFSGEEALAIVREHAPEVRFVFLSGAPADAPLGFTPQPPVAARLSKDQLDALPMLVRRLLGG